MGPVYAGESLRETLCPWCIADGRAASTFGATLSDAHPLRTAGLAQAVIDEVTQRTPGYVSWQQDEWASHCDDACAFLGDLPSGEVDSIEPAQKEELSREHHLSAEDWQAIADEYEPAGQPAIYVFRCIHCGHRLHRMDYT